MTHLNKNKAPHPEFFRQDAVTRTYYLTKISKKNLAKREGSQLLNSVRGPTNLR